MPKRKTKEEFIEQLKSISPNIIIQGNYINNKTHVECECATCGNIWKARPDNLLHGYGCPRCGIEISKKKRTKPKELFEKLGKEKFNNYYSYNNFVYVNDCTKGFITCPIHGDFLLSPSNHLLGHGCPLCSNLESSKRMTSSTEEFIAKAKKIHGNKYDYSKVDYTKAIDKVCIICLKHGEFWQKPNSHLNGLGCPTCRLSHGENYIETYLQKLNILYIKLYKIAIDSKINKSGLAYIDFYLPEYNTFIEYNGEQHYRPILRFGGEVKFIRLQNRDSYVRIYANEHNIKLIEISYLDNINDILNSSLYE